VLLLDHAERPGKKILISGGGRANFTNLHCTHENFLSENPHFARSALSRFTPADMIAMVEQHRIPYHEKTLGQLFCDRSARDLVQLLETECAAAAVAILCDTRILAVASAHPGFSLQTSRGELRCESLIVATGGLSIPKMGATGLGYELARQFGLRVVEPRPGLVPFTLGGEEHRTWCDLSGVATEAIVSTAKSASGKPLPAPRFREKMLLTHRGLSGPAILQVSSYWLPGESISIDLAPGRELFEPLLAPRARRDRAAAHSQLREVLPARLAERFAEVHFSGQAPKDLSNAAIAELEREVHAWRLTPAGTEGFVKAEVTVGGVDTAALNPKTLEARTVPGLFFVGEVVDVTGWLGGYNFQWAWASGFCAGQAA
jgi:predicted Rossmann fold flavoprotein